MPLPAVELVRASLRDLRHAWPQLLITDLAARALTVTILVPVVGALLKLFLATTPTGVVTDAHILPFLVHPTGLAALVIVPTVMLAMLFAASGALMVIGYGAGENLRVTWITALWCAGRRSAALTQLAASALLRLVPLVLPVVAIGGVLFWRCAREHDINYYLAERPPAFVAAAVFTALLIGVTAILVCMRLARWSIALPLVLFTQANGRTALRTSTAATAPYQHRLTLGLIAWLTLVLVLPMLVTHAIGLLGDLLIPRGSSNVALVLTALGLVLLVALTAHLAVSAFSTVLLPLMIVRLYRRLGAAVPAAAEILPQRAARALRISRRTAVAAGIGVLAVLGGGGYLALRAFDWQQPVVIIAHRGGAAVAPENTCAAFERGIADGADWLELDVQEDADGTVIVVHDRDFMRIAGARLNVWEATAAERATLDVGRYRGPQFAGQRVPTLREVLELARNRAGVVIELKYYAHQRTLESRVVELVEQAGMQAQIVLMSLEYDGLQRAAALRPGWTRGLLSAVSLGDLTRLDVGFLALSSRGASRATIRHAHRRGLRVYAWTINDPVQMSVFMSRGVDGIITDQVALARHVRDFRAQLTPLGRLFLWLAGETGLLHGMEETSGREDA